MGQNDETDKTLWERYTADIDRIGPANVARDDAKSSAGIQISHQNQKDKAHNNLVFHEALTEFGADMKPMPIQSGENSQTSGQIDKRTAARLKRGQMPIDARIDLHGLYQRDAKIRLLEFIAQSSQRNDRCVLVVTGKGQLVFEGETPKAHTPGVIKRNFKSWLAEEPYASMILKIEKAQMKDGGEGAYYILLRRRR